MPMYLKKLMTRVQSTADDGADLGGDNTALDDDRTSATPEDRGDFLPGEQLDPEALSAVAAGAEGDEGGANNGTQGVQPAGKGDEQGNNAGAATEEDGGNKGGHIPKARFDEVNERRKAAEQEAERLRLELEQARAEKAAAATTKQPDAPTFDVDAKEKEYMSAVYDGDADKAAALRREINTYLMEQATSTALERSRQEQERKAQERAAVEQQTALQAVAKEMTAKFPYLDTEEGADAVDLILARREMLVKTKGMPIHEALRQAAEFIAPKFDPAPPAKDVTTAAPKPDLRQAAAVERGAKASVAQAPAPVAGMGNRATGGQVNVADLDDDQFAKLSEAEKRRMRGD